MYNFIINNLIILHHGNHAKIQVQRCRRPAGRQGDETGVPVDRPVPEKRRKAVLCSDGYDVHGCKRGSSIFPGFYRKDGDGVYRRPCGQRTGFQRDRFCPAEKRRGGNVPAESGAFREGDRPFFNSQLVKLSTVFQVAQTKSAELLQLFSKENPLWETYLLFARIFGMSRREFEELSIDEIGATLAHIYANKLHERQLL